MINLYYTFLQIREVFHLEFLRRLSQKLKPGHYVLKGGVNLRLFFSSPRYSEDVDLDIIGVDVSRLQDIVMDILLAPSFQHALATFGIRSIGAPDLSKAKQTETTQRFKIHLGTAGGEDLFTKIEFSRRGVDSVITVEHVNQDALRKYHISPFICPHYGIQTAFLQKINALANRSTVQARDVFDLFLLGPHLGNDRSQFKINSVLVKKAIDNAWSVDFLQFRDAVLDYFSEENRTAYNDANQWDDIRLTVVHYLEEII